MNFLRRIFKAAKRFVQNRYEAAYQRWGERSWLQGTVQDARYDADAFTRLELIRRHSYWVANNGLVQRIRNLFIQFSVGVSGLECVPNSSDEDYNEARKLSWDRWGREPELSTHLTLSQLEIQWAGSLFDNGELFIQKTIYQGKPKVVTIESHRVATPPDQRDREGKDIIDGIHVDAYMKPIGYFVRDAWEKDIYAEIKDESQTPDGSGIHHIFKARRPGMMRGLPEGFSVMNDIHDLDDLQLLQMQKAKAAAVVQNVITNASGEMDPTLMRKSRFLIQTQNAAGQAVTKNNSEYYSVALAGRTLCLKTGEEMKQFKQEEPGIVTQQYWDYLTSKFCCGYNVPKLLVMPYSLQGTVTRADLDIATNAFRANFEIIALAVRSVYEWQGRWEANFDRAMDGKKPGNYLAVVIRPPRSPNVDVGYTAKALALELELGVKTIQDVYAEKQQDWRVQLRQIAETEAFIDSLAKEFKITPERISNKVIQQSGKSGSGSGSSGGEGDSPENVLIHQVA